MANSLLTFWELINRGSFNTDEPESAQGSANQSRVLAKRQEILDSLSRDVQLLLRSRLEARHLMTQRTMTVEPTVSRSEVLSLMKSRNLRHLLVTQNGGLLGVISDRDVIGRDGQTARDIMTPDPKTVSPTTGIGLAISFLINETISCLPVVDGKRLRGVITTTDLLMTLQCCLLVFEQYGRMVNSENGEAVGEVTFQDDTEQPADGAPASSITSANTATTDELTPIGRRLQLLQSEMTLGKLESDRNQLAAELRESQTELDDLRCQLAERDREATRKLEELQAFVEALRVQVEDKEKEQAAEIDQLRAMLIQVESERNRVSSTLQECQSELDALRQEQESYNQNERTKQAELEAQIERLDAERNRLVSELAEKEAQLDQLREDLIHRSRDEANAIESLRETIRNLSEELEQEKTVKFELTKQLRTQQDETRSIGRNLEESLAILTDATSALLQREPRGESTGTTLQQPAATPDSNELTFETTQ